MAGVISSPINSIGTVGVAPDTRTASARVFISRVDSENCDTGWDTQFSWSADALQWAVDIGARITNNSNIYGVEANSVTLMYKQTSSSLLHFGSAGNDPEVDVAYPAELFFVQAVSSMDWDGALSSFSRFGPEVAFTAPGSFIFSTDRTPPNGWSPNHSTTVRSGTSYSSPMAAGAAAMVISQELQRTPFDALRALQSTARDLGGTGRDIFHGFGLIDTGKAAFKEAQLGLLFSDDFETGDLSFWSVVEN